LISYFTDGSASPNPGPGGFGVIKNGQPWLIGGEPSGAETTNIRMEGFAILTALEDANGEECEVTTDSEFWINVLTKWAPNWERNNWQKKGGIKNLDLVQPLYEKYKNSHAKLVWTRAHVGTKLNEMADEYANKARELNLRDAVKVDTII